jgi:hypothetical protein
MPSDAFLFGLLATFSIIMLGINVWLLSMLRTSNRMARESAEVGLEMVRMNADLRRTLSETNKTLTLFRTQPKGPYDSLLQDRARSAGGDRRH